MTKKEYIKTYEAPSLSEAMVQIADASQHSGMPALTVQGKYCGRNCVLVYLPKSVEELLLWTVANPPKSRTPDAIIYYPNEESDETLN